MKKGKDLPFFNASDVALCRDVVARHRNGSRYRDPVRRLAAARADRAALRDHVERMADASATKRVPPPPRPAVARDSARRLADASATKRVPPPPRPAAARDSARRPVAAARANRAGPRDRDPARRLASEDCRLALVMWGAISPMGRNRPANADALYAADLERPLRVTANAIVRHVLEPNAQRCRADAYLHSWNAALRPAFREIFTPHVVDFVDAYEDNRPYYAAAGEFLERRGDTYNQWSQAVSMGKAAMLLLQRAAPWVYDHAIFFRPDVLLTRPIDLAALPYAARFEHVVYASDYAGGKGDFHFVCSSPRFAEAVVLAPYRDEVQFRVHHYLPEALRRSNVTVRTDHIRPGFHEEVYRKLRGSPMGKHRSFEAWHTEYNVSEADWSRMPVRNP